MCFDCVTFVCGVCGVFVVSGFLQFSEDINCKRPKEGIGCLSLIVSILSNSFPVVYRSLHPSLKKKKNCSNWVNENLVSFVEPMLCTFSCKLLKLLHTALFFSP